MIRKGGAYDSSKGLVESWEIDTRTGVKTYTAGNRAGQTEQVTKPMATVSPSDDSGNNTLMWIGIAVSVIGIGWFFLGKKKRKKR